MKKLSIITVFLSSIIVLGSFVLYRGQNAASAAKPAEEGGLIKWHTFQEALMLSKKEKKKVFIDVFTSWCGWCKVMDKNTFTNPVIAKYMNEHFYCVKLNAEMKDTVVFNNYSYVNPSPNSPRSTHQLAAALLNNQLSYPTTVFLDENFGLLTQVPGYMQPTQLEPIIKFFGADAFKTTQWQDYQKSFKGEISAEEPQPPVSSPH